MHLIRERSKPIVPVESETDLAMKLLWPDMSQTERLVWSGLPEERKAEAFRRLDAIKGLERVGDEEPRYSDMSEAIEAAGTSRSGFYAIAKNWRAAPSLEALGVHVTKEGPGRTAAIEQRHRMLGSVRRLLADDPDLGGAEIRRGLAEEFGKAPSFATVRRLMLDARRDVPPRFPFGGRVVLDSAGLDVIYDEGIPVRLYVLLDVGTDLALGWSIWGHGAPVGGYVRAVRHALEGMRSSDHRDRIDGYGLTALNLDDVRAQVPDGVDVHFHPDDADLVVPLDGLLGIQLKPDKSLGRLTVDALGERLGKVWIGAGFRHSGVSYRIGSKEAMPTLTPRLARRIDDLVHDHNLRRLSLMPRDAQEDVAPEAVSRLRTLLGPMATALAADGYGAL